MKENLTSPFFTAVVNVLEQIGVSDITHENVLEKNELVIKEDLTAFIGIVGDIKGNVSYCCSLETAKNLASIMMMGMEIEEIDDMCRSALSELLNMIAGNTTMLFSEQKVNLDITSPSVVVGEEMFFILSFYKTISLTLNTSIGVIGANISLEI